MSRLHIAIYSLFHGFVKLNFRFFFFSLFCYSSVDISILNKYDFLLFIYLSGHIC